MKLNAARRLALTILLFFVWCPSAYANEHVPRGNKVFAKTNKKLRYDVGASARLGVLMGGGDDVVQRFGYGFAAEFRLHFIRMGLGYLGASVVAGHTRFTQRTEVSNNIEGDGRVVANRQTLLGHTDFSVGPSVQIPISPVVIGLDVGGGVMFSSFFRPHSIERQDDEILYSPDPMVRGAISIAVPIVNNQGLALSLGANKVFSPQTVVGQVPAPMDALPDTVVFDFFWEAALSYRVWF